MIDIGAAELIILNPPASSREAAAEFVGGCIVRGLDLYFEPDDRLPRQLPAEVVGVKAIVLDRRTPMPRSAGGSRVYVLDAAPNARWTWHHPTLIDMLIIDANLTLHHPLQITRFVARDDGALFAAMIDRLLEADQCAWHDATCYQWDALLDAYELAGDDRCLAHVRALVAASLQTPNPLDNCDTVAPLGPIVRLADLTGDEALRQYAMDTMDAYLAATPRWRGVLVGFSWLANHARAEVVWQVGAALCKLTRFTGERRYLDIAVEQARTLDGLLFDPAAGLWKHGRGDEAVTDGYWGRGCAFVFLALLQLLETMPADHPDRPHFAQRIATMADALVAHQHASGFWYTVIDEPLSAFESSGTAWIVAGLLRAMRLGLLDRRYQAAADLGWRAVKSRIWRGGYPGHNTATTISADRSYYVKRHLSPTGWTHFAFRAACERRRFGAG